MYYTGYCGLGRSVGLVCVGLARRSPLVGRSLARALGETGGFTLSPSHRDADVVMSLIGCLSCDDSGPGASAF